ncbi:MAG: alcohol acetyltransferase, partial [Adlercreutzia sp.]|nr:alcohol acetyltransferase [Adlercreutzia sp.]
MAAPAWYRLDNVGKFYASQAGSSNQTVFRLAATMTEPVDAAALQRALDATIERFPGFNVCLRSGLFWHYLEPAKTTPTVQPETLPVCYGLHTGPKSVLFRVTYYQRRINVEVSHMISDGRGSLEFLKALLAAYAHERYHAPVSQQPYPGTEAAKTEDSFSAHYDRDAAGATDQPKIFRLPGWKTDEHFTYLELHYSAAAVHARAKAAGATVTSWLIAAAIAALRAEMPPSERNRAIHMDVPVDLRSLFGSTTLRNFFGLAFVSYIPGDTDETLAQIAAQVQQQMTDGTEPTALKRRMMTMVKLEKNLFLRMAPLFVKDLALDLAAWKTAREVTCTVSSLGRVTVDEAAAPYVEGISALT